MPMTAPWRLPVAGTSAYCDWRREAVDRARAWRFTPVPPAAPPRSRPPARPVWAILARFQGAFRVRRNAAANGPMAVQTAESAW